jgi:hypothetical protein
MKSNLTLFIAIAAVFLFLYSSLCIDGVYNQTFGKISDNWVRENDIPVLKHVPMTPVDNHNAVQWDAVNYKRIMDDGYNQQKAGGDYIFAFFPLFPFVWKVLHLPTVGMMVINYLLFVCAFLLLQRLFTTSQKSNWLHVVLAWTLPSVVIYIIPYSEALFMLTVSIGLYGMVRKNYTLFFIGFFFASLCRPAYTFLFLSILCVEVLDLINHRSAARFIKSFFTKSLPLILGTLTVGLIQWFEHKQSIFKFVEVQKYWNNELQVPRKLADWSHEGFGINVGVVWLVGIPLFLLLLTHGLKRIRSQSRSASGQGYSMKDYLMILSAFFTLGSFLFILMFRGGSLHCMFRFTLCTPFFYMLFLYGFDYIRKYHWLTRLIGLMPFGLAGLMMLGKSEYSGDWNFSDFGFFLLCAALVLFVLQEFYSRWWYRVGLLTTVFANLFWTAYLLNMYINNGWIFA